MEGDRRSSEPDANKGAIPKPKPKINIITNDIFEQNGATNTVTNNMINCFGSVLNIFGNDFKYLNAKDTWEVPYEALTNESYLCSGAQGIVYSASLRGEIVAVKKVRSLTETNIKHLAKLKHENIVQFRGVCVDAPHFSIIMEYCQYGSLFNFLAGANLRPQQLVRWAKDIAAGMNYLHSRKIIHRDLKSPNILIADDLQIKVSDFGTCRTWDSVSTIMTFSGTVPWMAPEIIRQEPCTERVDVWSYGVVLWELLTKEVPYRNLETPTILWGVGTKALNLPIPVTCPNSIQMILCQCFNIVARNRPSFKIILAHLDMAAADIVCMDAETFTQKQAMWGEEVRDSMARIGASRERQLKACRCGARKTSRQNMSTSSDTKHALAHVNETRRRRKKDSQLIVTYVQKSSNKSGKTVTRAVDESREYYIDNALNNNLELKNTIVERNGNVQLHKTDKRPKGSKIPIAQV